MGVHSLRASVYRKHVRKTNGVECCHILYMYIHTVYEVANKYVLANSFARELKKARKEILSFLVVKIEIYSGVWRFLQCEFRKL